MATYIPPHAISYGKPGDTGWTAVQKLDNNQKDLASKIDTAAKAGGVPLADGTGKIDAAYIPSATQAEAEAGVVNDKYMTPLRVKQFSATRNTTIVDLDTLVEPGLYNVDSGSNGTPGMGNYVVQVILPHPDSPTLVHQWVTQRAEPRAWFRFRNGDGAWSPWRDVLNQTPPGIIAYFGRPEVPYGWLVCNGAAISRATYANLFAAISTTYGVGDGSTTFNLPDLRGEFIRGWDAGIGTDPGRVFGSYQADAMQRIIGTIGAWSGWDGHVSGAFYDTSSASAPGGSHSNDMYRYRGFDSGRVTRTAAETRPRNRAMLPCIKY